MQSNSTTAAMIINLKGENQSFELEYLVVNCSTGKIIYALKQFLDYFQIRNYAVNPYSGSKICERVINNQERLVFALADSLISCGLIHYDTL